MIPAVNVNLRPCDCPPGKYKPGGCGFFERCEASAILIPCPIPSSVTFQVRLGECNCTIPSWWTDTATAHAALEAKQGRTWTATSGCACGPCQAARRAGWLPDHHNATCPANPIRVTCSISGKTWEESEVDDVEEVGIIPGERREGSIGGVEFATPEDHDRTLAVCRERWKVLQALVLGHMDLSALLTGPKALELLAQRDAMYAALADMARAQSVVFERLDALPAGIRPVLPGGARECPPHVEALSRYVEHLIEQVGAAP